MHRATRMEVSLRNIVANFHAIRAHVRAAPEIFAVVKADAYGHGAVPVASALLEGGCRRFAVAIPDEAFELREGGITAPILVLGPSPERSAREYVLQGITPAVTDLAFARALNAEAVRAGAGAVKPARGNSAESMAAAGFGAGRCCFSGFWSFRSIIL